MTRLRKIPFVLCGLALLLTACGGGDHEARFDEMLDLMNDTKEVLEGVTDRASAEAARGRLEELGARMKELGEELQDMGEPSQEVQKRLMESGIQQKLQSAAMALRGEVMRIGANPELGGALGDAMQGLKPR